MLFRRPFAAAAALALVSFAAAACDEETEGAGPIPIEQAYSELAHARCEMRARCGISEDVKTCLDYDVNQHILQLVADVGWGRILYDEAAARVCAENIRNQSCSLLLAVADAEKAACTLAFAGNLGKGARCYDDEECSGANVCSREGCAPNDACCAGSCGPAPALAQVGGDCTTVACARGAFCNAGKCEAVAGNGGACMSSDGCDDGLACSNGKCFKRSTEGQSCNPDLGAVCIDVGTWCDPDQQKCLMRPKPGQACSAIPCQDYALCDGATCVAEPKDGQACVDGGVPCRSGLDCAGDVCPNRPARVACY